MKIEDRITEEIDGRIDIKPDKAPIKAYASLAKYENTGLSPAEIKEHEEIFKAYRHACGGLSPEEIEEMREKQIPKEPINKFEQLKFQTGYCPRCSTSVCGINHYCTVCGQALKWSD